MHERENILIKMNLQMSQSIKKTKFQRRVQISSLFAIYYKAIINLMPTPTQSLQLRLLKMMFGPTFILKVQTVKYLYETAEKSPELEKVRQEAKEIMIQNIGYSLILGLAGVFVLQRVFPGSYGKRMSFTNSVIDLGIFMLSTGSSFFLSLNQMEPILEPLKKKWISQHNRSFMIKMKEIQRKHQISILNQIEGYVPKTDRAVWKLKFDDALL